MDWKLQTEWIIYHFKTYIWSGTFRYYYTRGRLNYEGGGELQEIKRNQSKTKIDK